LAAASCLLATAALSATMDAVFAAAALACFIMASMSPNIFRAVAQDALTKASKVRRRCVTMLRDCEMGVEF
jgi:hypothetical protein